MGYRNYSTAVSHIVDATGQGDFTTISAAITAAVSGETIFIRPGTYTENPTLKAGVNLAAYNCDALVGNGSTITANPNVRIAGKVTASYSGAVSISGICLQTNSDFAITIPGSVSGTCNLALKDCQVLATNNTAIQITGNGSFNSNLYIYHCLGYITGSGIAYFTKSGAGEFQIYNSYFQAGPATTAASSITNVGFGMTNSFFENDITNSAATVDISNSELGNITLSSSAIAGIDNCSMGILTCTGTSTAELYNCFQGTFTSTAISIGSGCSVKVANAVIETSATNAIGGSGTLIYGDIAFSGTSSTIQNTLTLVPMATTNISSITGTANQILASTTGGATTLSLIGPYTPATYTAHGVLLGEGTSSITTVGPTATTGQVLQNNSGADPTYSTATYPSTTTANQLLYSSATNTVSGLATANNSVLTTGTGGTPVLTSLGTDGQLIIGSSTGAPAAATLTAGTGISVTNGHNSISIAATGVTGVSSVTGTANQILASPTTGAVVLSLVGPYTPATYTAHGVLVGEGTSSITTVGPTATTGQVLQNNSGADPTYSTATYPSTTTANQLLYSSATNTVAGLSTANNSVLTTGTSGTPVLTSLGTNGQLIIGSSSGAPAAATLTAGSGITITNAANSITIAASGGSGITTIDGDTGSVTGSTITLSAVNDSPSAAFNASGTTINLTLTDASNNVILGGNTTYTYTGSTNTGVGNTVLSALSTGQDNCAFGYSSLAALNSGQRNCALGRSSLLNLSTGTYNTALGYSAGSNYTTSDSSNISINNGGVSGESNTLRIGAGTGTSNQQLNKVIISGIYGITTVSATTSIVLVSNGNQLGTIASSEKFKKDIKEMGDASSPILLLNPVTFKYKAHTDDCLQFGLIAEQVDEVMPGLVNYDDEGKPFSVRYHDLPALLLNEIIKLNKRIEDLEKRL